MIKAVIFDWGGVISLKGHPHAFREHLATALGTDQDYARSILGHGIHELLRGKITEAEYWKRLETAHGAPIPASKRNVFDVWDALKPNQQMTGFVSRLKARGYTVALLSNVVPDTAQMLRDYHALEPFDEVILSTQVGMAKPDQEIYQLMLNRLKLDAGECLFVDDQQRMLDPASTLGVHTILATEPEATIKEIERVLETNPR